jgi:hypothetical protein
LPSGPQHEAMPTGMSLSRAVAVGVVGEVVGEGQGLAPYAGLLEPYLPT